MRILWIPQISSLSSDGKVYLPKDSNMSALYNILDSDFGKKNEINIAFEFALNNDVVKDYVAFAKILSLNGRILDNYTRNFTNAKLERFSFDANWFVKIKNDLKHIDVVFVNEPTKVEALKAIFTDSVIATYNHWLACKNMKDIELRQYEGMCNADICFVNSEYAKNEILKYYKDFNKKPNIKVSNPTFIESLLDVKTIPLNNMPNIIYNHRLSSDPYYDNALKCLERLLNNLGKELNKKPLVYFTNPTGKNINIKNEYFDYKEINLMSKKDYFDFLSSDKINIHLNTFFESEGMWCQSTVDSAIKGNICLLPRKFGYKEMFNENYYGYCENEEEMLKKLKNLFTSHDTSCYYYTGLEKSSSKFVGDKLMHDLLEVLEDKNGKTICTF